MQLQQRIDAFVQLGHFIRQFAEDKPWAGYENGVSQTDYLEFNAVIKAVKSHNGWFTEENVRKSIFSICTWLTINEINKLNLTENKNAKTIAVIMAGNIPLVGFHDVMCVLLSGNKLLAKFSSDDNVLMPLLLKYLIQIEPNFNNSIRIASGKLTEFDAVIATGNDNSSKHFEYYFGKYPNIIRHHRTSVAVLTGNETNQDLKNLGNDIFDYFGLGCRNVTKIFIPQTYNLNKLFGAIFSFKEIIHHNKYANNYDYHKAIFLLNKDVLIENGFLLLRENKDFFSPVAVLNYERYENFEQVTAQLAENRNALQCIVGNGGINFGETQKPGICSFADDINTIEFLNRLK